MLSSGRRIPLLFLLLLLLSAMELSWSFTDEEKQKIVDQHNLYRSIVSPSAANMLKMHWDPELETFAQNYSTKCTWEHNKERGYRGENLFAMTGYLDLERAMEDWYIEYQYYNYSTMECKKGEMCGHYTQIVWAHSERVGCGTTFCETLELINDTDMHLFVCNYQPPGNIRGRQPYIMGASCSMCPEGYFCTENLCDSTTDVEETPASPTSPEWKSTTSPDLQSSVTVSAAHIPESPQTGTETGSEPPVIEDQPTISTASSDLLSTTIVSVVHTPEGSQSGTEAQSEPNVTEKPDVTDLHSGTDGIDESLMTTTSATTFTNLIPSLSSISPETGTKKTTGTEHPSPADVLITTQTSLVTTERSVMILTTTTKTPSTPKQPSVPKAPPVPKTPSVPKPSRRPKPHPGPKPFPGPKPPHIDEPPFFPKPPPILIKPPISKKPARHRLIAYSKAIQRSSNSFQSSAAKAASMSVCLPCLGCKQISHPEDIKTALEQLTFRYPYAPCFDSLPRWQRHSKCSWCGHTRNNALRNTRPYWLHTL